MKLSQLLNEAFTTTAKYGFDPRKLKMKNGAIPVYMMIPNKFDADTLKAQFKLIDKWADEVFNFAMRFKSDSDPDYSMLDDLDMTHRNSILEPVSRQFLKNDLMKELNRYEAGIRDANKEIDNGIFINYSEKWKVLNQLIHDINRDIEDTMATPAYKKYIGHNIRTKLKIGKVGTTIPYTDDYRKKREAQSNFEGDDNPF